MQKIVIDFQYEFALCGIKEGDFCNFLRDEKEYILYNIHIISKMVSEISKKNIEELRTNSNYHTHQIKEQNKREKIKKILKSIIMKYYNNSDKKYAEDYIINIGFEMNDIWQISCPDSKGIRIIGFLHGNIFKVLFIDYFHLIYPDAKNNTKNISKNNFCPINFMKGGS